jgi:uncharacterized membrane protein
MVGSYLGLGWFFGRFDGWPHWGFGWGLARLISLVMVALWVLLMIHGFQGRRLKLPIAGDLAEKWSARPQSA